MVTWFVHKRVGIGEFMFVRKANGDSDEEFE
jgi:hypothetical protein